MVLASSTRRVDTCLYCGQKIPLWTRLLGEDKFCSAEHKELHQEGLERAARETRKIAGPQKAGGLPEMPVRPDQPPLGRMMPLPPAAANLKIDPRQPPLIRLSVRYRIGYPEEVRIPAPLSTWQPVGLLPLGGQDSPRILNCSLPALSPEPARVRRDPFVARFGFAQSLLRLSSQLRHSGEPAFARSETPRVSTSPAILARYRHTKGFPLADRFVAGSRLPGLRSLPAAAIPPAPLTAPSGSDLAPRGLSPEPVALRFPAQPLSLAEIAFGALEPVSALAPAPAPWSVRTPETGPLETPCGVQLPQAPEALRLPWLPDSHYVPLADAAATASEQVRNSIPEPAIRAPLALKALDREVKAAAIGRLELASAMEFVPAAPAFRLERLRSVAGSLRQPRITSGVYVPQPALRPLRPRLYLADAPGSMPGQISKESSVISISSLRSAGGGRR